MDLKTALKTSDKELYKQVNAEIAAKKEAIAKKVEEELKDVSLINTWDWTSTGEVLPQELMLQDNCWGLMNCIHSWEIVWETPEIIVTWIFVIAWLGIWLIFSLLVTMCICVANLFKKVEHPFKTALKSSRSYHFIMFIVIAVVFFLFYYCFRELDLSSLWFNWFYNYIYQ